MAIMQFSANRMNLLSAYDSDDDPVSRIQPAVTTTKPTVLEPSAGPQTSSFVQRTLSDIKSDYMAYLTPEMDQKLAQMADDDEKLRRERPQATIPAGSTPITDPLKEISSQPKTGDTAPQRRGLLVGAGDDSDDALPPGVTRDMLRRIKKRDRGRKKARIVPVTAPEMVVQEGAVSAPNRAAATRNQLTAQVFNTVVHGAAVRPAKKRG